ncbi:MAG: sulfite exporter TauE/SafE family protein [Myxococcales bacterium]|nr:sulfite exporter TauE/SafE family protein [Myxococcales bacterium]
MFDVVTAGAIAGLLSAPHCAVMCGPLGVHATRCGSRGLARYQVARSASYAALGVGAGLLGKPLISALWSSGASFPLSVGLALVMLVGAFRIWPQHTSQESAFSFSRATSPEELVPLRPRKSLFRRVLGRLPKSPELIGTCSALLPCGALWSGVALSVATGSPASGAVLMVAFSLTSGVGVWASSRLISRVAGQGPTSHPLSARALALTLAMGAAVLVWRPLAMGDAFRNQQDHSASDDTIDQSCPLHAGGDR